MGAFTTVAKNNMIDSQRTVITHASLHSADPGENGENELTGGSYARVPVTFEAAANGRSNLSADVTFEVPAGSSVLYVGYWDAEIDGVFQGSDDVPQEDYTSDGQYILQASGTYLEITD